MVPTVLYQAIYFSTKILLSLSWNLLYVDLKSYVVSQQWSLNTQYSNDQFFWGLLKDLPEWTSWSRESKCANLADEPMTTERNKIILEIRILVNKYSFSDNEAFRHYLGNVGMFDSIMFDNSKVSMFNDWNVSFLREKKT